MEAIKYLKELDRMCKYYRHNCKECLLLKSEFTSCKDTQVLNPKKAVEIVENWSVENPQKTMLQDFLEKYPNVQLNNYGCPSFCPSLLGYDRNKSCLVDEMNCKDCWNRPLEG